MKRPTKRVARHSLAAAIAAGALLVFAGVGLSQVVAGTPQDVGGSTSTDTSTTGTTGTNGGTTTGDKKQQICHKTHSKTHPARTISVSMHALPAHLAHGDHTGKCTDAELHPSTTTTATTSTNSTTTSPTKDKTKTKSKGKTKTKTKHAAKKPAHASTGGGKGKGNGK